MKFYRISEFAELIGVNPVTLRIWEREGKLIPYKTPSGERRYSAEMVSKALIGYEVKVNVEE